MNLLSSRSLSRRRNWTGRGRKVSSEEIQRFRSAIGGRVAKGIFFTTTTFSEDAKREAKVAGKVEIELVDLDRILEICESYAPRSARLRGRSRGPRGQPHIDLGAGMGADFGDDFESFAGRRCVNDRLYIGLPASLLRVAEAIKTDGARFD